MRGAKLATPEFNPANPVEQGMGEFDLFAFLEADLAEIRSDITEAEAKLQAPEVTVTSSDVDTIVSQAQEHPNAEQNTSDDNFDLFAFLEADLAEIRSDTTEPSAQPAVSDTYVPVKPPVVPERQRTKRTWAKRALAFLAIQGVVLSGYSISKTSDTTKEVSTPVVAEVPADAQQAPTSAPLAVEAVPILELYLPKPGDLVGTVEIEAICLTMDIIEYSEQEDLDLFELQKKYNNKVPASELGNMTIDQLIADDSPDVDCAPADQREAEFEARTGRNHIRRAERTRGSAMSPENPEGHVIHWKAIGGHSTSVSTTDPESPIYTSALPWTRGNAVFPAHSSTYNGGFADLRLVNAGDELRFITPHGDVQTYTAIQTGEESSGTTGEIIPESEAGLIYDFSLPDAKYEQYITLYACTDPSGEPGEGSSHRYVQRFIRTA